VNRLCGSGLDAVAQAARQVRTGEAELVIAGGVESMSRAPYVVPKAETAFSRNAEIYDTTIGWRFINPLMKAQYGVDSMPETAENVAAQYGVSREDQDAFALRSQERTANAIASGRLAREIAPVSAPQRRGDDRLVDRDEHPRETTIEALAELRPIAPGGTVTAGNAPGVNDGGSALVVTSAERAAELGVEPLARFVSYAVSGIDPKYIMLAPVEGVRRAVAKAGWQLEDVELFELNEAFSVQALGVMKELGLNPEVVNVNGGAVAMGHAIGNSGGRVLTTLLYEMKRRGAKKGVAALCLGGGNSVAMAVERD
jgi:acetyl-CoA acyltransferase